MLLLIEDSLRPTTFFPLSSLPLKPASSLSPSSLVVSQLLSRFLLPVDSVPSHSPSSTGPKPISAPNPAVIMVLVSVMAIIAFDADDKDAIPVSAVEGTNDDDGATA